MAKGKKKRRDKWKNCEITFGGDSGAASLASKTLIAGGKSLLLCSVILRKEASRIPTVYTFLFILPGDGVAFDVKRGGRKSIRKAENVFYQVRANMRSHT